MNRLLWLLLNGVLVATAYGVTMWVLNQVPAEVGGDADWSPQETPAAIGDKRAAARGTIDDEPMREGADPDTLDVLWRETLFRPDRSEELTVEPTEEEKVENQSFNLELVGLAQIGQRSIAVIVEHRASVRRLARRTVRAFARNRTGPAAAPDDAAGEEPVTPDRHVYAVGDEVGGSGYTVKEIRLDEEEVVIIRGNEERILTLDKNDDQSSSRLQSAAAAAEVAQKAEAAAEKAEEAQKEAEARTVQPPPPPPPPVAGTQKGPDAKADTGNTAAAARKAVTEMTREERLERARLLRERILQRRSQKKDD